jgi:hypothetical protein
MTTIARAIDGSNIQALRLSPTAGDHQTVAVGASSTALANAVADEKITVARVVSTTNCHVAVGTAPTATTSHAYLPAGVVEYFRVNVGDKLAFIQNSAAGTAFVTWMR